MATFGKLALKSDDEDDDISNQVNGSNGFSTIDLNGTRSQEYTSFESNKIINTNESSTLSSLTNPKSTSLAHSASGIYNGNNSDKNNNMKANKDILVTSSSDGSNIHSSAASHTSPASMMSSATEASTRLVNKTASTIQVIREWSKSAYKCTRQLVSERLGKTTRTVDPELESAVDHLRDSKRKYENMLSLSRSLTNQFAQLFETQKQLADVLSDLSQKTPELIDEFNVNAQTQRQLYRHGEILLKSMHSFNDNVSTLLNKTMEDTFQTIRLYEAARLEFDANRLDLEALQQRPPSPGSTDKRQRLEHELAVYKDRYDKLKSDVEIKMKFLNENRFKVMRKQMLAFQNAMHAFYVGNKEELDAVMAEFNYEHIKSSNSSLADENSSKMISFLEHNHD